MKVEVKGHVFPKVWDIARSIRKLREQRKLVNIGSGTVGYPVYEVELPDDTWVKSESFVFAPTQIGSVSVVLHKGFDAGAKRMRTEAQKAILAEREKCINHYSELFHANIKEIAELRKEIERLSTTTPRPGKDSNFD